jgi:hypothetical protein
MANQRVPVITTEYGEFASELAFCNSTLLTLGRALTVLNVSGCGIKASQFHAITVTRRCTELISLSAVAPVQSSCALCSVRA